MIGQVIEGQYQGSNVYRYPEKNVLYIQTEEGKRITLSKQNVISIENISDQYPDVQGRVLMVLWNDFETSILQLGTAVPNTKKSYTPENKPLQEKVGKIESTVSQRKKQQKKKSLLLPLTCAVVIILVVILTVILFLPKGHDHKWIPADCLNPEKCEVCGETRGEPLGHTIGETENDLSVCARCGEPMEQISQSEKVDSIGETTSENVVESSPSETEQPVDQEELRSLLYDSQGNPVSAFDFADAYGVLVSGIYAELLDTYIFVVKDEDSSINSYFIKNSSSTSTTMILFTEEGEAIPESGTFDLVSVIGSVANESDMRDFILYTAVMIYAVDPSIGGIATCAEMAGEMIKDITLGGDAVECTINGIRYSYDGIELKENMVLYGLTVNLS